MTVRAPVIAASLACALALAVAPTALSETTDPASGLVIDEGLDAVRIQCTRCHSAKLVTQNRATREGWTEIIRWMQRTQKLGPLGDEERVILDYLAKHYAPGPGSKVRRRPLPSRLRPPTTAP